jgi:hypothetical protein
MYVVANDFLSKKSVQLLCAKGLHISPLRKRMFRLRMRASNTGPCSDMWSYNEIYKYGGAYQNQTEREREE